MKKNNNKGFTLVELIIVVAIVVTLAMVLAPMYGQYVERSRQANDLQVATNLMRAATVAVADPQIEWNMSEEMTIRWTFSGALSVGRWDSVDDPREEAMLNAVAQTMGWVDENGVYDPDLVPTPESAAGRDVSTSTGYSLGLRLTPMTGEFEYLRSDGGLMTQAQIEACRWYSDIGLLKD